MISLQDYANQLLEHFKDMERLELIIFDRTAELLLYRAFIREKGLETEFKQRMESVKATDLIKLNS